MRWIFLMATLIPILLVASVELIDWNQQRSGLVLRLKVVERFDHDKMAFTQGLLVHDGALIEGTGLRGASSLRLVDINSGKVLKRVNLDDQYFGEGVAVLDGKIYQLTWESGKVFVYDLESFEQIRSLEYEGEGWGLTTDGKSLIMSNGSDVLEFRDPETFEILRSIRVRDGEKVVRRLNELEYIEGEIWANVWKEDYIARIDPQSGKVSSWIDARDIALEARRMNRRAEVLNGIAFDAESGAIYLTGKNWPVLYLVMLP